MLKYSTYMANKPTNFTISTQDMQINYGFDANREQFNDTRRVLKNGNCEGAVIISVYPLYIAAYASEMDAIVLLDFSDKKLEGLNKGLRPGSKLITVNGYETDSDLAKKGKIQKDLIPGEHATYQWQKVFPVIADFIVEEKSTLEHIKREFSQEYWDYIFELGNSYFQYNKGLARLGTPDRSDTAFLAIDAADYYKKVNGGNYKEYLPADSKKKKSIGRIIVISIIGIVIYLVIYKLTDANTASIFKSIFKILF